MKINIDNYEAFFLDFVEGRLDNSSTLEMLAFLRKNPHLKDELESFSEIKVPVEDDIFTNKDFLKKLDFINTSVNSYNFDDYCIAYHEEILNKSEADKLFAYLDKHPEKKNSFNLFGKATLIADANILYEGKSDLYRKAKGAEVRTIVLRWTAVAAGVALLFSVFYKSGNQNNLSQVVERTVIKTEQFSPVQVTQSVDSVPAKTALSNTVKVTKKDEIIETAQEKVVASLNTELNDSPKPIKPIEKLESIDLQQIVIASEPVVIATTNNQVEEKVEDVPENALLDFAHDKLVQKVFKKTDVLPRKKITIWDVAQATIKGYNSISESDVRLSRKTDKNGKLKALALETENRKYGFNTGKQ